MKFSSVTAHYIVPYAFLSPEGPDKQEELRKKYKKYFIFYFNTLVHPTNIIYDIANSETISVVNSSGQISFLLVYFNRKTPQMMKQLDYMILIYGKYITEISYTNNRKYSGKWYSWAIIKDKYLPVKKINPFKQNNSLHST